KEREQAIWLHKSLKRGQQLIVDGEKNPVIIKKEVINTLKQNIDADIDYVDILEFPSLQMISTISGQIIIAAAIYFKRTRLIDNLILDNDGLVLDRLDEGGEVKMYRTLMKAKIHRARDTHADLKYIGSITIDQDVLERDDIIPNGTGQLVSNTNGARLETYVIAGERGTGMICLNGAAARLVQKGDTVIIISYALVAESDTESFTPKVAIMNENNQIEQMIDQEMPLTKA